MYMNFFSICTWTVPQFVHELFLYFYRNGSSICTGTVRLLIQKLFLVQELFLYLYRNCFSICSHCCRRTGPLRSHSPEDKHTEYNELRRIVVYTVMVTPNKRKKLSFFYTLVWTIQKQPWFLTHLCPGNRHVHLKLLFEVSSGCQHDLNKDFIHCTREHFPTM